MRIPNDRLPTAAQMDVTGRTTALRLPGGRGNRVVRQHLAASHEATLLVSGCRLPVNRLEALSPLALCGAVRPTRGELEIRASGVEVGEFPAGGGGMMGWFLRKSFRVGPLRLNLSKRGIGASVGMKGARLGVDATGKPAPCRERGHEACRAAK